MTSIWPAESAMTSFYGNPDPDGDGKPNAAWEAANLIYVPAPWAMRIRLDSGVYPVTRIRFHRKCAPALVRVFSAIKEEFPSQAMIDAAGLDCFGGAYEFRTKRGLETLSTHAFAASIDLSPERNPLGQRWRPDGRMMDSRVVSAFKREGAKWGGDFKSRPDCMHFQFTA